MTALYPARKRVTNSLRKWELIKEIQKDLADIEKPARQLDDDNRKDFEKYLNRLSKNVAKLLYIMTHGKEGSV